MATPRLPLARMATEGLLIVLSILFAFAIDAWWDERKDRHEEAEILQLLHSEYAANVEYVNLVIDGHLEYRARVKAMLDSSDDDIRNAGQQTLSGYVVALCNPWTFDPVLGTTDALVSAGKLDMLEDRALRVALTAYLNKVDDAAEDAAFMGADAMNLWRAEIDLGGPWTDPATEVGFFGEIPVPDFVPKPTAEDVLRLRSDRRLVGTVRRCHINIGYYLMELYRLRSQAADVLALIDRSRQGT